LLIGERADREIEASIAELAMREQAVERVNSVLTLHMAPEQIVVALSLEFADNVRTSEIENAIFSMERRIRETHPQAISIFVKPQTQKVFKDSLRAIEQEWPSK